jgi:putative Mg2+ transporter-C (MgtC) family protein
MLLRLGIAMFSGVFIGINRDLHNKPAGLRVLALVAVGSCAVTMGTLLALDEKGDGAREGMFRTVQGILSGMGFLGAGVILRGMRPGEEEVTGLATAASIWVSCILGILAGLGEWLLGGLTFAVTMLILTAGHTLERIFKRYGRERKELKREVLGAPPIENDSVKENT